MKALTLHQPWATALAAGFKHYETRPRKTNHRGLLAIHAGLTVNESGFAEISHLPFHEHVELSLSRRWATLEASDLPTGAIIAIADLTDCLEMTDELIAAQSEQEVLLGDWQVGRYAYKLENVRRLPTPVVVSGKQGMWNVSEEDQKAIHEQLSYRRMSTDAINPL